MLDRALLQKLASDAGFGANLRNTHAVRLERFAAAVERVEREKCAVLVESHGEKIASWKLAAEIRNLV